MVKSFFVVAIAIRPAEHFLIQVLD